MRVLHSTLTLVTSGVLHVMALLPLVLLAFLGAPEVVDDDEEIEVYAEGDADNAPGPLVDDAVLTVTILHSPQDWSATEVNPDATPPAPGEEAPPQAAPASQVAKDKAADARAQAREAEGDQGPKDEGGEGAAEAQGDDAATAGAGSGSGTPNPKAQSSSKKPKKVCPPNPDIARIGTWQWGVERSLIEKYAGDMKLLNKVARVTPHQSADGKPDGFRLGLPQCSPLRLAGFKTGDIVKDVNKRKIHNVLQAVAAYFTLRNEKNFTVHLDRKGQILTLRYKVDHGAARDALTPTTPTP